MLSVLCCHDYPGKRWMTCGSGVPNPGWTSFLTWKCPKAHVAWSLPSESCQVSSCTSWPTHWAAWVSSYPPFSSDSLGGWLQTPSVPCVSPCWYFLSVIPLLKDACEVLLLRIPPEHEKGPQQCAGEGGPNHPHRHTGLQSLLKMEANHPHHSHWPPALLKMEAKSSSPFTLASSTA